MMMRLVRDVLDKKLIDSDGCETGRVDGIAIEFPEGRQPRMVRLEMGGEILAARVARWLVKPAKWLGEHFGPRRKAVIGIDWKHVDRMGRDLHLDIKADDTEALAWEHWLADRFISKIPGGA
jgi:sporulation protein YlmC with PRC-barrel domain